MKDHGEKTGWTYRPRSREEVHERATQRGGQFDRPLKEGTQDFSPKEGSYRLRFMPPTWEPARHFGIDVYTHYGIGADNQTYLCIDKMREVLSKMPEFLALIPKGDCPICRDSSKPARGEEEDAKDFRPKKRVGYYVIDRKNEESGPLIWIAPWTFDLEIAKQMETEEGEVLAVDDPREGYDGGFTKSGQGIATRYTGMKFSRTASPISDDEDVLKTWMRYIIKNPLPAMLAFYEPEHIEQIFNGGEGGGSRGGGKPDAKKSEDAAPVTRTERARVPVDSFEDLEVPPKKAKPVPTDDEDETPPTKPAKAQQERFLRGGAGEDEDEPVARAAKPKPKISAEARKVLEASDDDEI